MSLHLVLSVIILHYLSELNAPRENIRFHAVIRQRWTVNQEDRDGSPVETLLGFLLPTSGQLGLIVLFGVSDTTWKLYLSLL